MNKCNFCKVSVADATDRCPLCGAVLEGNDEGENTYPNVLKKDKAISFVYRLMIFLTILFSAVCLALNFTILNVGYYWSFIVVAAMIYALLIIRQIDRENTGYRKRTLFAIVGAVLLVILVDWVFGLKGWSISFVIPGAIVFTDIALLVLMIVNRRNWQSYIILQALVILFAIIPLVLAIKGIAQPYYYSYIAFTVSVFEFLGTIIIGGRRATSEVKRRFHVR